MNYLERERKRLVEGRDGLFKDPGSGLFAGKPREFVLSNPATNLWEGIREDAIDYFARNKISWWRGGIENEPTGHLLSSQVACVNHLFGLRQRPDLATAVLAAIDPDVIAAEMIEDGLVAFEFIGAKQRLQERAFTRGTNCTSVDAFMIGRLKNGSRLAFLIEWKYTETYGSEDKYIPERAKVYDHLIAASDSPFEPIEPKTLYVEPFYQMMRQTLLGWQMSKHEDYGCTSYRHVHVVPVGNTEFASRVTAPMLTGTNVSEAWKSVLKVPELYINTTPEELIQPLISKGDTRALTSYLQRRYWDGL